MNDWEQHLPLRLKTTHPLWQRLLELYSRAAERFSGKVLLVAPDLHTNMDLLAAIRGRQRLCMDLIDCPDLIDCAMSDFAGHLSAVVVRADQSGSYERIRLLSGIRMPFTPEKDQPHSSATSVS